MTYSRKTGVEMKMIYAHLNSEDKRTLKEASGRRGCALPRTDRQTGYMLGNQWVSWQKLQKQGLASIEPCGGEAECLALTELGKATWKQICNSRRGARMQGSD
jgi:hypothetical protein